MACGLDMTGEDLQVCSGLLRVMSSLMDCACLSLTINSTPDIIGVCIQGGDRFNDPSTLFIYLEYQEWLERTRLHANC